MEEHSKQNIAHIYICKSAPSHSPLSSSQSTPASSTSSSFEDLANLHHAIVLQHFVHVCAPLWEAFCFLVTIILFPCDNHFVSLWQSFCFLVTIILFPSDDHFVPCDNHFFPLWQSFCSFVTDILCFFVWQLLTWIGIKLSAESWPALFFSVYSSLSSFSSLSEP